MHVYTNFYSLILCWRERYEKIQFCQQQAAAIPDSIGFVVALSAIAGLWIGNWQVFLQSLQQMS